jgi:FAD/FMN-containing dehydrogenase
MIDQAIFSRFKAGFRGDVIEPGDERYESARKVYNGMIDRRPRIIVRPAVLGDITAAVRFGAEEDLLIAVRGGGHNGAGLGTCDDGMVIDLSRMKAVQVDPQSRTVLAEAGCTQGDVDAAASKLGLAVPAGIVSTTGIAGLTLGGGHGYLTRKHGLAIDNLIEAAVVLADGRAVKASRDSEPDLFWAIRGGGGNFGIVTSFLYKAHPVEKVVAGPVFWDLDRAEDILGAYREFLPDAPEDTYAFFKFLKVPAVPIFPESIHGKTMCGIIWCYLGPPAKADTAFAPVRKWAPPAFQAVGSMPFVDLQRLFDPLLPPGLQWYWKGHFVKEVPDGSIREHLKFASRLPSDLSLMHLYPIDGAASRVGRGETAFSYRDARWSMVIAGIDPDPKGADRITAWTREYWSALQPYSESGAYVNFMMEEGEDRIRSTYRENHDRLVVAKRKYDPDNLFRVNQNIKPRVTADAKA